MDGTGCERARQTFAGRPTDGLSAVVPANAGTQDSRTLTIPPIALGVLDARLPGHDRGACGTTRPHRPGEKRWRACTWAGLAAAVATGLAVTVAAAQEAAVIPSGTDPFPTLDRRAQVAPSVEFNHLRALASRSGPVRVIVGLRVAFTPEGALSPADREAQHRAIASAGAAIRAALNGTEYRVVRRFELVPVIVLELSEGALTRLQNSGLAATLWVDTPRPPPTLAEGASTNAVGRGGAFAMLDTGVDRAYLRSARVVSEACFSANGNCPNGTAQQVGAGAGRACTYTPDGCQHGTQAAGIAARRGGTDIIAIQVFSRFTGDRCTYAAEAPCVLSYESDHIAGLEHVFRLRNTVPIGAASLSLGSGLFSLGCNGNPVKLAIDNLRSVGIATLIPSGSGGLTDAADAPACISAAMTVSARDKSDGAAPASPRPGNKALPDLVVKGGGGSWPDYITRQAPVRFEWEPRTKNVKDPDLPTRPAAESQTAFKLENAQTSAVLDLLNVPELSPGEVYSHRARFQRKFSNSDYGTYRALFCADASTPDAVNERDENNNCADMSVGDLGSIYVVPTAFSGTVKGAQQTIEGATVSWKGTTAFGSFESTGRGALHYRLDPEKTSITFTLSGTIVISGKLCTWSGKDTYRPASSSNDGIDIDFTTDSYHSQILVKAGFILQGKLTCPEIGSIPSPVNLSGSPWLDTGEGKPFLDPGLTPLQDQYAAGGITFTWNLEALDEGP